MHFEAVGEKDQTAAAATRKRMEELTKDAGLTLEPSGWCILAQGWLNEANKRHDLAKMCLDKAVDINTGDVSLVAAHKLLGDMARLQEDWKEDIKQIELCLSSSKSKRGYEPGASLFFGRIAADYLNLSSSKIDGRAPLVAAGLRYVNKSIELEPNYFYPYYVRSLMYSVRAEILTAKEADSDYVNAKQDMLTAIKLREGGESGEYLTQLAQFCGKQGNTDECLMYIKKALTKKDLDGNDYFNLGVTYASLFDLPKSRTDESFRTLLIDEAIKMFEKAKELKNPFYQSALPDGSDRRFLEPMLKNEKFRKFFSEYTGSLKK
jgi:tetratricopeptide (TPR) repeat protein